MEIIIGMAIVVFVVTLALIRASKATQNGTPRRPVDKGSAAATPWLFTGPVNEDSASHHPTDCSSHHHHGHHHTHDISGDMGSSHHGGFDGGGHHGGGGGFDGGGGHHSG